MLRVFSRTGACYHLGERVKSTTGKPPLSGFRVICLMKAGQINRVEPWS
ncbi:hypothetical protein H8702_05455 [Massilimaliae timonensis]|uniref:Uncharacterized protein n=2 Tax=Massiliimalia timonensis TaxID=1987501 RepID=A0A8J6PBV9_9FIRM|nr:hypothetical protein [Massiliimalia timonensis]MBC8610568.1 hypothetical protein [Massiliimalia timonensis]